MEDGIISTNGRIRRSTYVLRWACIKIPYWILKYTLIFLMGMFFFDIETRGMYPGENIIPFAITFFMYVIVYILYLVLLLPQIAKRLHDMDKSGWLAILIFLGWIPYIGWIFTLPFFLVLALVDGTIDENQYGEDPKQRVPYIKNEIILNNERDL